MNRTTLRGLGAGDVVRHIPTGLGYVVSKNTRGRVDAERKQTLSNPPELYQLVGDSKVPMTHEMMQDLRGGDIVGLRYSGIEFVVTKNRGRVIDVVRTVRISDPSEWELVSRAKK